MVDAQVAACLQQMAADKKEQDARIIEQQAELKASQEQIKALIEALKNPQGPSDNAIRAEKVQKLTFNLCKSSKLKPFKISQDVKMFQKLFIEQLTIMKAAVGITDDLSREEYIPIFRSCLDFPVVERVGVAMAGLVPKKTWADVTIAEMTKLMVDEFGSKQTDVANVLELFGPHRLCKKPDESVSEFFFRWQTNIPEVMKPGNDNERITYVDLIERALFLYRFGRRVPSKIIVRLKGR